MIIYFSVALGVVVSIVLPLLKAMLPQPPVTSLARPENEVNKFWQMIKPYVITGVFSLMVAVVIVALLGDTIDTWQKAFLAGYTADSTLQKLTISNRKG